MCRISGLWDQSRKHTPSDLLQLSINMRDIMAYGGPDHAGIFVDDEQALYLGHRRLSILDLSEAGNQPFSWRNYHLIFNGEIYNFQEIKDELSEFNFESNTDTEVIIKAWHKWGVKSVEKFRGMFSFALYNSDCKKLYLVRDRLGVKPLYYYFKDGFLLFGSELKSLMQYKNLDKDIDQNSLSLYFQQGYIPSPNSILKSVKKINPGSILTINSNGGHDETVYWSATSAYTAHVEIPNSLEVWKEKIKDVLIESINYRMVSDVPVGSFLSGGIDSSLVTSIAQKHSNKQLKTFTIGFNEPQYNEAEYAKKIAEHIGSEHHEYYVDEQDFSSILPNLPEIIDEPLGDPSIIPTYIVSKMAKQNVKVCLSADGGDELFGGYTKYEITKNFYPKLKKTPSFLKKGISNVIQSNYASKLQESQLPVLKNYKNLGPKLLKFSNALTAKNSIEFFNAASTFLSEKEAKALCGNAAHRISFALPKIEEDRLISFLGLIDVKTYLEGDILTKVDRATMQNSLEGREPLLDHVLFEWSQQMPDNLKIIGSKTKVLLREILSDYVPMDLINRPKQGFAVPIEHWLNSSLKSQVLTLQDDSDFIQKFNLRKVEISDIINNFYSKGINPQVVWYLYVLYSWYIRWLK